MLSAGAGCGRQFSASDRSSALSNATAEMRCKACLGRASTTEYPQLGASSGPTAGKRAIPTR